VFVDEEWRGFWTHPPIETAEGWTPSRLCLGEPHCGENHDVTPRRWCAFAGAIDQAGLRLCVVHLTHECCASIARVLLCDAPLRGARVRLERVGAGANGLVRPVLVQASVGRLTQPPIGVEETLRVLWRLPCQPSELLRQARLREGGAS
jgi:hypothetical protein